MDKIPNIKVIDNEYFDVFANKQYSDEFLNRLCDKFLNQRKKILEFFNLSWIGSIYLLQYLLKSSIL